MYIKINGSDEHYNASITTFSTQHGNQGVRVIGDMPQTNKGFILYDDNDNIFNDLSDFVYSYGNNGNEYTKVKEIIEEAECSFEPLPPSSYDMLVKRISSINNKVNTITPYTETKNVYIGDIECVFDNVYKSGNINAFLVIDGEQKPCEITTYENYILVTFDEAENTGTITISVQ